MGGGSSTTTQDTSSSTYNQIPEWVSQAGQQNYALAQNIAEQPLQQYQGQMVAGISPQTQQAWNLAAQAGGLGQDQYNAATAGYLGALGQTPMQVTAGQLSNTNLQPYMNPYTQSVINTTLPIMQQQLGLQQNQQQNAANAANAFGGSRQAVQQGVTQAQGAQNMAQMAAQLQQQNFQQAQAGATGDINRQLQAQQLNQAAQQAKINSDIAASQGLTGTADALNKAAASQYTMLNQAGMEQQNQAQQEINAQMQKFQQAWQYPYVGLGLMESTLGQTPYPTATQTAGQTTSTATQSPDWANLAQAGLQGLSSIWGMFGASDRSMKTDITPMGKDPDTGLKTYAFRYKGDPKSYPKVVGPMAQDVAKIDPGAVKKLGSKDKGKLAVRGYKFGTPNVGPNNGPYPGSFGALAGPARQDTVPAMLTPGEAVLTGPAAQAVGRHKIAALNAMMPPSPVKATSMPRAGARGLQGALANTKLRPKVAGALSGGR